MTKKRLRKREIKKMDRDCWNLDMSFIKWLEPRLKQYLKRGGKVVDLTYHKFVVMEVEKTQEEWINEMILLCDYLLNDNNWCNDGYKYKMHYLCEIWAAVMPAMWW